MCNPGYVNFHWCHCAPCWTCILLNNLSSDQWVKRQRFKVRTLYLGIEVQKMQKLYFYPRHTHPTLVWRTIILYGTYNYTYTVQVYEISIIQKYNKSSSMQVRILVLPCAKHTARELRNNNRANVITNFDYNHVYT